jgi:hypothetical protein
MKVMRTQDILLRPSGFARGENLRAAAIGEFPGAITPIFLTPL